MASIEAVSLLQRDPIEEKLFVEELRTLLARIKDGENGAEGLLALHRWIHEAKEAGRTDAAMHALVGEGGIEVVVGCMQKSANDTILATRVLEVLAGESSSNASLPLLTDKEARAKLIQLGFVQSLLTALDLPDLQSVACGLGCRALRELGSDGEAFKVMEECDGVKILMCQVAKVVRPFAFGALALLSRCSHTARQQIRDWPQALPTLIHQFAEHPDQYNTAEDPAASLLFLTTWSWDEILEVFNTEGLADLAAFHMLETCYHAMLDTSSAHAPALVLERWRKVHELLPSATARVHREAFVQVHEQLREEAGKSPAEAHDTFINALFTAATGLMLPKQKDDLGKHCFGYVSLVSNEYCYECKAVDGLGLMTAPAISWFDPLATLRVQLNDDWANVQRDATGSVALDAFKKVLLKRHEPKFGGIDEAREAFECLLDRLFEAGKLMAGPSSTSLDRHSFLYVSMMAYEFYFSDARDKELAQGCGCSTPVADNLGITR